MADFNRTALTDAELEELTVMAWDLRAMNDRINEIAATCDYRLTSVVSRLGNSLISTARTLNEFVVHHIEVNEAMEDGNEDRK